MTNSTTILKEQLQFKQEELEVLNKNEKGLIKKLSTEKTVKTNNRVSLIAARVTFRDGVARRSNLFQAMIGNVPLNSNKYKKAIKKFCKNSLTAQATPIVEDTTTAGLNA